MKAAKARELYATLLEDILMLAETVKGNRLLQDQLGETLSNLLNLLSVGEFIKAVENLLGRPNITLRQKVLRALEVRIDQENKADTKARTALLAFLPELTSAIRNSDDIRYKHTAVTCIDKIAEKYGKMDPETVAAAAATIAGEHCLGQSDRRLRLMSLVCLASLVDVLQDGIVPILTTAMPLSLLYLEQSLQAEEVDEDIHNAVYTFVAALAEHTPYMVSAADLDRLLKASNKSAEVKLDRESDAVRKQCLELLGTRVDAKVVFGALQRNWASAMAVGFEVSLN
jgi:U3 small nucleolar RNA-associated protein 10